MEEYDSAAQFRQNDEIVLIHSCDDASELHAAPRRVDGLLNKWGACRFHSTACANRAHAKAEDAGTFP